MVGAVDPRYTETWNTGPAKGPLQLDQHRDWLVQLRSGVKIKKIKADLEHALKQLEMKQISHATGEDPYDLQSPVLTKMLDGLGVDHADSTLGSGRVHLTMAGVARWVEPTGGSVPWWLSDFLREPTKADVLRKLAASGAKRKEALP